jgi:hypothetical protein
MLGGVTERGRGHQFANLGSCRPAARWCHRQQSATLLTNPTRGNVGYDRTSASRPDASDKRPLYFESCLIGRVGSTDRTGSRLCKNAARAPRRFSQRANTAVVGLVEPVLRISGL